MTLEEFFVTDIIAFVDQAHFAVEAVNLMPEILAAYLVACDFAAAANPAAVAAVQAEVVSVASIVAVEPVIMVAVLVIALNLLHLFVIVAALEPLIDAFAQSAGYSA